jgi:hypothetical protein
MRKLVAALTGASALVALSIVVELALAVPCGPSTCAPASVASPGSRVLLVRPQGLHGPLAAYDILTGKARPSLPEGALSADGRRFIAVAPHVAGTRVISYNPLTGARVGSWTALADYRARVGAVSANGRFAALVAGENNAHVTVVDLARRTALRSIDLPGRWDVDALSRDGSLLYLLEFQADGSYRVRLEQAGRGLVPGAITDPSEAEPMAGFPWSSIGTRDGRWQLTLFLKSSDDKTEAFIHALSLDTGRAKCIDLQTGAFMAIGRYALVLSPNGRTLYAANPSLGVVSTVDLTRRAVVSTVRFRPRSAASQSTSGAFGTISRDGRTVFFSSGVGLHAYDTRGHTARELSGVGEILGVGVAPSGKTLLVVRPDGTSRRLDAR